MPIINRQTDKYDRLWGYDTDQGEWVPLDKQTEEGSFVGNVARGAGREMGGIALGLSEMSGMDVGPEVEQYNQESAAAGRSAPYAETIGGLAPDVLAALGVGAATQGTGLLPMLAGEAATGAALGGARPGTFEDRVERALYGAGGNVVGAGVGTAAGAGIKLGINAFRNIVKPAARNAVEDTISASGMRIANARKELAGEAVGPDNAGSVGAARTPDDVRMAGDIGEETAALEATDRIGAGAAGENKYMQQARAKLEERGYISPLHAGSRGDAPIRRKIAQSELMPAGIREDFMAAEQANNQKLLVHDVYDALGMPQKDSLALGDLADARETITQQFNRVEKRLPPIPAKNIGKELRDIVPGETMLEDASRAERILAGMIRKAEQRGDGAFDPQEIMRTRSRLNAELTDAYRNGDTDGGEVLRAAIDKIDKVIERTARRRKMEQVADAWSLARSRYQTLLHLEKGSTVSPQGEINVQTLRNSMKQKPVSGGYGPDGPRNELNPALRRLWDNVNVSAADQTGQPMTGARLLMGRAGRRAAGTVASAYGAGAMFNTLFGN